ncbi:MAG: M1 family metallopeptidase [Niabella sp.]
MVDFIRKFKAFVLLCIWLAVAGVTNAQSGNWQQAVKYTMDIDMDVQTNRFAGKQRLEYWNNSPDTLDKVFYHLYWNAFQPGSMMDERSRRQGAISFGDRNDWDPRVTDRISHLKDNEIGYQKIISIKMNGVPQIFEVLETVLKLNLSKPILPKQKVVFDMVFEAQVPLQIRRSGRDNPDTKVRYSMSQWYPKICAYDVDGWHPTPYVGREFYGVFGDFNVNITIDKNYILGGTGYITNPQQIGYGYEQKGSKVLKPAGNKVTWKFIADNVHDFMWAADPDFIHKTKILRNGLTLHILYKPGAYTAQNWEQILIDAEKVLPFLEKHFGTYPYKQYSFITGGDGGMEYPMATLLAGPGAWLHEWLHSWYQGVLGFDETRFAWMDEGFTSYAENLAKAFLRKDSSFAHQVDYDNYILFTKSGYEEPLITHADHFNTNKAYAVASYTKGSIFLEQLGYILGADVRNNVLLEFYKRWKFKSPTVNDFIRLSEKISGSELDWYQQYWINSTRTIDYAIDSLWEADGKTKIRLRRDGLMPMPIDFEITFKDGSKEMHYVPLDLMYNAKPNEDPAVPRTVYSAWHWTNPTYTIETNRRLMDIRVAEIDPSQRMADVERRNNKIKLKY